LQNVSYKFMPPDIYYAQDAIDLLSRQIARDDAGTSSHWRQMHATFNYADGQLSGLRGFGTFTPRSNVLKGLAHRLLQPRWRRLGLAIPGFARIDKAAAGVALAHARIYDLDVLRQALTVAYLEAKVPAVFAPGGIVIIVGDGFGTLASLLLAAFPTVRIVVINLVKTLLVDLVFIRKAAPKVRFALVTGAASMKAALADETIRVIAVRADDWQLLKEVPATLAVNIASMQEMEPRITAQYLQALRATPSKLIFYCCNREEKILPDGTVARFEDYPWQVGDTLLDDGLCPWHQDYYSARPPFIHRYDGPLLHRLAVLAPEGR
jgi:putative sugar O-methyltransferase